MAEQETSGSNTFMAFVLGGVVIALGVIAFFAFGGELGGSSNKDIDVKIEAPNEAPKADSSSGTESPADTEAPANNNQ